MITIIYCYLDAEDDDIFGDHDDEVDLVAALGAHDVEALLGHIEAREGDVGDEK